MHRAADLRFAQTLTTVACCAGLRARHTLRHVGERDGAGRDLPAEVYQDAVAVMDSALRGDRDAVVGAFDAAVDRGGVRGA